MDILILGGDVDASMAPQYSAGDTTFRGYAAVIADARAQLEWLLNELSRP